MVCVHAGGRNQRRAPQRRGNEELRHTLKLGDEVKGKVARIAMFGAFLELEDGFQVLLGASEMLCDGELNPQPRDLVKEGQEITVRPPSTSILPLRHHLAIR